MSDGYYIPQDSLLIMDFDGTGEETAPESVKAAEVNEAAEDDLSFLVDDTMDFGDDGATAPQAAAPIPHDDFERDWDRQVASIQF